ncbi:MAG: metallopeptidase family protein [Dehalococcoidia bacterium]|nr:metallopeptidase family protein [Dehalococcoidia bacterium]
MERERFEELVMAALEGLPPQFAELLHNVDVVVEDAPTRAQRGRSRRMILGLYEGVPLTVRRGYNLVPPDKITIFQRPLEAVCASEAELKREVQQTVLHELGHHFGLDDDTLSRIEAGHRRRRRRD